MTVLMIVLGVLMILCGFGCILTPAAAFSTLSWLTGVAIIVAGVAAVFRYAAGRDGRSVWELIGGVAGILLGGLIVANGFVRFATDMVIAYAVALWILLYGVCGIAEALSLRRLNQALPSDLRTAGWLVVMLLGAATAAVGVVCLFQPMITILTVGLLVGISILISGIKVLVLSVQLMRAG